jgi:hypothetical protein
LYKMDSSRFSKALNASVGHIFTYLWKMSPIAYLLPHDTADQKCCSQVYMWLICFMRQGNAVPAWHFTQYRERIQGERPYRYVFLKKSLPKMLKFIYDRSIQKRLSSGLKTRVFEIFLNILETKNVSF